MTTLTIKADNEIRAARAERILVRCRMGGDLTTSLIDLLADAMHWCDVAEIRFQEVLVQAEKHYVYELKHHQLDERRLIP